MLPFHTVLCPLDFSESSFKALQNAAEIASHFQSELILVHVLTVIPVVPAEPAYIPGGAPVMPAASMDVEEQRQQELAAEERLKLAIKRLPSQIRSRIQLGLGDAADEIVRIANTYPADLIVIATHGLTGWRHLVFGSVAEKVIRSAHQPVLVITVHDTEKSD